MKGVGRVLIGECRVEDSSNGGKEMVGGENAFRK